MKNPISVFAKTSISEWITILCVVLMMFGFLFNRVLLSLGMILLFVHALNPSQIKENFQNLKRNRFSLYCLLFFLAFLISGFWSDDKASWLHGVQVKLPFVIMPFAMLGACFNTKRMIKTIIYLVLSSLLIGVFYSLIITVINPQNFLSGEHIVGPVDKDYLRFTLALVLGINLSLYLLFKEKSSLHKFEQYALGFGIALFVTYIHIQASKLGLAAYYILFFIFVLFYFLPKKGIFKTLGVVAIMGVALSLFLQFPTFKNQAETIHLAMERVSWVRENDKQVVTQSTNESIVNGTNPEKTIDPIASSFTSRTYSYKAGFNLIKKHPILGVGSGDLYAEMEKENNENFRMITFTIIPHNQFIYTMAAIGIPLSLTLFLMFFYPLFKKPDFFEVTTVAIMLCGIMVESMLQVQFGVFVYLFFTLFWIASKQAISNKLNLIDSNN